MPLAYFLQLDGITGGATLAQFKNQIELTAFNVGVAVPIITSGTGTTGAGKASFSTFTFIKPEDIASPQLFAAVSSGKHLAQATLTAVDAASNTPIFHIKLTDVLVSAFHLNATSALAEDTVSLVCGKMEWTTSISSISGILTTGIDVLKNLKV